VLRRVVPGLGQVSDGAHMVQKGHRMREAYGTDIRDQVSGSGFRRRLG
jgi:hypothetical protein